MGAAAGRLGEYERLRAEQLARRQDDWLALLNAMATNADPARTVMGLPYSSSWLFTTGTRLRWAVDPAPAAGRDADAEARMAAALRSFDFFIVTHLHGDHCDAEFLRRFAAASAARWIVPAWIADDFSRLAPVAPDRLAALPEGGAVEVGGARIVCGPGFHDEPGMAPVPAGSFAVDLPDGLRLGFPVDVRRFDRDMPEGMKDADVLFAHLWLGRDAALGDDFPLLDPFCRFLLRQRPGRIVLGHRGEVGRPADSLWNHRHVALVRERLRALAPALEVAAPANGTAVVLEKTPSRRRQA